MNMHSLGKNNNKTIYSGMGQAFFIFIVVVYIFLYGLIATHMTNIFGIDFSIFYAASYLTGLGYPDLVYNLEIHHKVIETIYQATVPNLPYFYPPYTLFFFMPLSLVPFQYSFYLWLGFQLLLYLLLIYKTVRNLKDVIIALSFPGVFISFYWGQNSFLLTVLALGFIYYIDRDAIKAGVFLGLLCYKPQIALFFFIAAFAYRAWRCLAVALSVLLVEIISSLILWGWSVWNSYFLLADKFADISLWQGWIQTSAIQPTIYSFLRISGINSNIALFVQYIALIIMIIIIYIVWRKRKKDDLISITVLGLCTLLGLPYYIQYDMLLSIIPILFFKHSCDQPLSLVQKLLLWTLWILPILSWYLVLRVHFQIAPIIYTISLILCFNYKMQKPLD